MSTIEGLILIAIGFAAGIGVSVIIRHIRKTPEEHLFDLARRNRKFARLAEEINRHAEEQNP